MRNREGIGIVLWLHWVAARYKDFACICVLVDKRLFQVVERLDRRRAEDKTVAINGGVARAGLATVHLQGVSTPAFWSRFAIGGIP